jgi:micrococcal nuclease
VIAPAGDVGQILIKGGYAKVYIYNGKPFARVTGYQRAETAARTAPKGLWAACGVAPGPTVPPAGTTTSATTTTTDGTPKGTTISGTTTAATTTSASSCDPSYPMVCIPPPPPDLDCGDISFRNLTVLQPDPHRFDGDKDGIGCES